MNSAEERRKVILEILSAKRRVTYPELCERFGVAQTTIRKDIDKLSSSAPIYTVAGNGGGIYVADGWYLSKTYLCDEDEEMLRRILPGLQPEDQQRMQHILSVFAKPKITKGGQAIESK